MPLALTQLFLTQLEGSRPRLRLPTTMDADDLGLQGDRGARAHAHTRTHTHTCYMTLDATVHSFESSPTRLPNASQVPDERGSTKPAAPGDELVARARSAGGRVLSEASLTLPPPLPPPLPPKLSCGTPIDFALVLDESGSMKKPKPHGSLDGSGGLKAFAKELVSQYSLGEDAARFAVVSFAADATTRVPWSYDATAIHAGIDQMSADGKTSISDGFEAARKLFADDGRLGASKVVLLVADGEQSNELAAPGKTPAQTAVDVAQLVKGDGVTVFAWGFGDVSLVTLQQIATDPSKAILAQDIGGFWSYLGVLEATTCNASPAPPSPPPNPSPPPPLPVPANPPGSLAQKRPVECGRPGHCSKAAGLRDPDELNEVSTCNAHASSPLSI